MAIALDRPTLLTPGLKPVDPGFESWWVRPGGATVVRVRAGRPADGARPRRRPAGRGDGARRRGRGRRGRARRPRRRARDGAGRGAAERRRRRLPRRAAPPRADAPRRARDPPVRHRLAAGRVASRSRAARAATVVVGAPGGRVVEGGWPASALVVEIQRAEPPTTAGEIELPAPLAEPRLDFRVDRASALSYEVREGEYIQIIDVRGRQCSDFLAFNAEEAPAGRRARARRPGHAHADGPRVPRRRPALEVLRPRHGPAVPDRPGHGRPARLVRARVHAQVLRGHGLLRPRQLHRELQRRSSTRSRSRRARAGRR